MKTAVGVGVFSTGAVVSARADVLSIKEDDVLLALPGDRYFALPIVVVSQYSVDIQTFSAEEVRRTAGEDEVKMRDYSEGRRKRRTVAMGVRG